MIEIFNKILGNVLSIALNVSKNLSSFDSSTLSSSIFGTSFGGGSDLVVIGFLVFAIFIIGITLGKSKLIIGTICVYIGAFLERLFPFREEVIGALKGTEEYLVRIGIFAVFFLIVFFFLNKSMARTRFTLMEAPFFVIVLVSILQAGFIVSIIVSVLPDNMLANMSGIVNKYFATNNAQFVWALLPLISFTFLGRRRKKED